MMMTCERRSDELGLQGWRTEIDRLDTQLLELLVQRQKIVRAIGDYKRARGLSPLDPERWRRVLEANMAKARDLGLCPEFVHNLYHLIHDYSLQLESETGEEVECEFGRVATDATPSTLILGIQGGVGSFNEEAARFFLRERAIPRAELRYLYTSDNVMSAVLRGDIERGQCAVYNSAGGWVEETVEALKKHAVKIVAEFEIRIAHAIMIRPDQDFARIDTLMCHPQVFAQCARTLAEKYPRFRQISGEGELIDNARTAEALARREVPDTVAVMGSKALAEIYGLIVVEDNLQDLKDNLTRFLHVVRAD